MKTTFKARRTITKEYWACNVEQHFHLSESVAQSCIDRYDGEPPNFVKWTDENRSLLMCQREREGYTFKEIGRAWGISISRARQVYYETLKIYRKRGLRQ